MTYVEYCQLIGKSDFYIDSEDPYAKKIIEALEKQTPKKPIYTNQGSVTRCPSCAAIHFKILPSVKIDYCARCGQAIDWSDEE